VANFSDVRIQILSFCPLINCVCGVANYILFFVFRFKLICSGMSNIKNSVVNLYIKLVTHEFVMTDWGQDVGSVRCRIG
jgi:hypothetical protein